MTESKNTQMFDENSAKTIKLLQNDIIAYSFVPKMLIVEKH